MYKKSMTILIAIVVMSMILSACAPQVVKETVVVTQVVTEQVIVAGTPEIKEVVKTVIVEATPVPPEKKLEIFHWWTAPASAKPLTPCLRPSKPSTPTSISLKTRSLAAAAPSTVSC